MASKNLYEISYGGKKFPMRYVYEAEIACLRANKTGRFQEEPILQWLAKKNLGGVYIDAGAHVGNHSLFFAKFCPSQVVVSIEAHPAIYALLEENMQRNLGSDRSKWTGKNYAAWFRSGSKVRMGDPPHNNAGHTCVVGQGGTEVGTIAIDNIDEAVHAKVSVIKIDVEDVEEQVVLGAMNTLERWRPALIVERHSPGQLKTFSQLIKPFGYQRTQEWAGVHTFAFECPARK